MSGPAPSCVSARPAPISSSVPGRRPWPVTSARTSTSALKRPAAPGRSRRSGRRWRRGSPRAGSPHCRVPAPQRVTCASRRAPPRPSSSSPRSDRPSTSSGFCARLLDRPQRRVAGLVDPRLHSQQRRQSHAQHLGRPAFELPLDRQHARPRRSIRGRRRPAASRAVRPARRRSPRWPRRRTARRRGPARGSSRAGQRRQHARRWRAGRPARAPRSQISHGAIGALGQRGA